MQFTWDEAKRRANLRKHRINFDDASLVFAGPLIVVEDNRLDYGEVRNIGIGFLEDVIVIVVFVDVSDDEIRIISMRKANKHERKRYQA